MKHKLEDYLWKHKNLVPLIPLILGLIVSLATNPDTRGLPPAPEPIVSETQAEDIVEPVGLGPIVSWNGTNDIPEYVGEPSVQVNGGVPYFEEKEKITTMFEVYSGLDKLGRCGRAYANVCPETLPKEPRGEIGNVRPSGWDHNGKSNNNKYDWVDGHYVFNRCHLLAYACTGENANPENLITGTRSLNIDGMLPLEMKILDYVKDTGNHVLYRVTPLFSGDNLVAQGVEMEAYSVEDNGAGICEHLFAYNVEPGVVIDYATGENHAAETN